MFEILKKEIQESNKKIIKLEKENELMKKEIQELNNMKFEYIKEKEEKLKKQQQQLILQQNGINIRNINEKDPKDIQFYYLFHIYLK